MQNSNDDNDWGDLLPSLEETLQLLPELRETAEALGALRADPNQNDPKSSGLPGPPTSRAIEPLRNTPYDPPFSGGSTRRGRRPKLDLAGLYTPPRRRRNTTVASKDKRSPSLPTTYSDGASPKKGSYRAAIAKARLFITAKEQQFQFPLDNESDSDRKSKHGIVNSTALDTKEKIHLLHHDQAEIPKAFNSAQPAKVNSNVDHFSFVDNSQPTYSPPLIEKKRAYMGQATYPYASDSSEGVDDTKKRSHGAKLSVSWKVNLPQRKASAGRSASPCSDQKDIPCDREAVPLNTQEDASGSFRPRRRAAAVAMERARTQFDDPFPGLYAPRRVNRLTAEQKALMPKLEPKELAVKMSEFSPTPEDYKAARTRIPARRAPLFFKMESIDPEE